MPNECSDICSLFLAQIRSNEIINQKTFPTNLKLADVTPAFKKKDSTLAENYKPVSVSPTLSKGLGNSCKQISNFINKFTLFMWQQERVQYTFCIDDFNRKMENLPRSERICRCSINELIEGI